MNDQFIQGIIFDWNKIDDDSYLKQIEALKDVERLEFQNSISARCYHLPAVHTAMKPYSEHTRRSHREHISGQAAFYLPLLFFL